MHSLSRTGLALLGLTLVAPTTSWAGHPNALTYPGTHAGTHRPRHLCPKCQESLQQGEAAVPAQVTAMPGATLDGDCTTCQQAHGAGPILHGDGSGFTVVSNPMPGPTMNSGYTPPGHAAVGTPMSMPGPATMTTYLPPGNSPSGHAFSGGMVLTGEPAPIGVVQTGFRPNAGMPAPSAVPAGSSPFNPLPGSPGPARGAPGPSPGRRRPHVLARVLGLSPHNPWSEARADQRRSDHAAISFGPAGQPPSTLPASMVYGR